MQKIISPDPMSMEEFLHEMSEIRDNAVSDIMAGKYGVPPLFSEDREEASKRPEIIFFLQLGVYPEWREVHFLSRQIQRLDDANLVARVGKQIYDEAMHTKVLRDQLIEWGADPDKFWNQPIFQWSGAFDFMDKATHPAEYFACSNFIGEALFLPTIMKPMAKYDPETFAVYVEKIMPDEPSHIKIGRDIIIKYCTGYHIQQKVLGSASILAKQYCIGYDMVCKIATATKGGANAEQLRDALYVPITKTDIVNN